MYVQAEDGQLRKFESGTKRKPSFLESNSVFFSYIELPDLVD